MATEYRANLRTTHIRTKTLNNNQTTKNGPTNRDDEADSELNQALRLVWCSKAYGNLTFPEDVEQANKELQKLLDGADESLPT